MRVEARGKKNVKEWVREELGEGGERGEGTGIGAVRRQEVGEGKVGGAWSALGWVRQGTS